MRRSVIAGFAFVAALFALLPLAAFALFMDGSAGRPATDASRTVAVTVVTPPGGDDLAMGVAAVDPCLADAPAVQG